MTNEAAQALRPEVQIAVDVAAFVAGNGADLEAEHRALARAGGLPVEDVSKAWTQARADKAAREGRSLKARMKEIEAKLVVQQAVVKAAVVKQAVRRLIEPEPVVVAPRFVEAAPPSEGEVVLNPNAPYDTAKEFTRRNCVRDGKPIVLWWQGQFWRWNGRHYEAEDKDGTVMRGLVYEFLDKATSGRRRAR
jgi:putative DNA primase/helicase